jgi:hypothetical protein
MGSFKLGCETRMSFGAVKAMRGLVAVFTLLLLASPMFAQLNTGRISGRVTDQTGGAIANATIAVTEVATGGARPLMTDSAGTYAAPNLTPGLYTVHVQFTGFQAFERENVEVGAGSDVRVDVTLQPGQQNQTVTVTESLPLINTTNAQTGGTLQQNLLANIPVNGRNYRWLIQFVPGIMTTPGEGTTSSSTNGGGTDWANFMIDGLYDQSPYSKQSSVGGAGEAGDTTLMPLDAIEEVALITNPKAEYGWDPGVTMNVNLKSGTNNMHGSAYAYGRDQAFDARNAFASARQPVSFEQWGATLGGPIKKDKLFYFAGYESERLNVSSDFSITGVPTTADVPGGSTSLSIPDAIADIVNKHNAGAPPTGTTLVNALSANLAGCDPTKLPTTGTANTGAAIVTSGACSANQFGAGSLFNNTTANTSPSFNFPQFGGSDNLLGKIDYHLSDHHSLSGSYFFGRYHEFADASTAITQPYWDERLSVRSQDVRVVEIWTPNSSWLNEARVGWDHDSRPVAMADCAVNGSTDDPLGLNSTSGNFGGPNYKTAYNLVSGAPACGIPTIKLNGVSAQLGFGNNRLNFESDWQGADTVSYTRGAHQFKFGVDVRAESFNGVKVQDSQRGTVTFGGAGAIAFTGATALEDFLTGVPSQETIKLGNAVRTVRYELIAGFAQDDWRVVPRLTFNIGLRWELATPMRDDGGLLANFDPTKPSGMSQTNQLWPNQSNFLPHLGFAWDVTGKGTTTVRSSVGVAQVVPQVQNWITSQTDDLSAMPTGATLYYPNNVLAPISPVGTINNVVQTLLPTTNAGGIVTTGLPWVAGSNLFTAGAPTCGNPQPCIGYGADPHVKFPEMMTWNLNVQHAFTNTLSLDMGYVGSHSWDITALYNLNQPTPGAAGSGPEKLAQPYFANCPVAMGGQNLNPSQCFPWFSNIAYIGDAGGANYAALQAYLNEHAAHGLTFSVGYTLSHALGIQGGPGTGTGSVLNNACARCEYGNLNTDAAHHFSFTGNYNIPGHKAPLQLLEGWAINSSVNYLSGLPLNVVDTSLDTSGSEALLSNSTSKVDRWTLYGSAGPFDKTIGGAGLMPCFGTATSTFGKSGVCTIVANAASLPGACISAATAEPNSPASVTVGNTTGLAQLNAVGCYYVNGSAIVAPAQGTFGNMTRNELRGKPFGLWNASVTKDIKIKEKITAQFRAEFFNVLNTTLYSGVGVNLGSPKSFGAATSTPDVSKSNPVVGSGGPREIQLGLKLTF